MIPAVSRPRLGAPLLSLALIALPAVTHAAAEAAPAALDRVEIVARPMAVLPYRRAHEVMARVRAASADRVELDLRLLGRDGQPVPGMVVRLLGRDDEDFGVLTLAPDGRLDFPWNDAALAADADFVTDRPKNSLSVRMTISARLPTTGLRYRDLRDAILAAREVRGAVLPWWLRLVTPTINFIDLCYPAPGATVALRDSADEPLRRADRSNVDDLGRPLHCARFTDNEPGLDPSDRIEPAPGWQPRYAISLF
ncbi:hypothetical protein [Derxia lacustris]|uniref:hypothetical protein n=1 Tax=Derxia lacustris TaxID=764842 RepID=UPI000A17235E|nr:hypothetical protein [Derxia lacustris]